MKKEKRLFGKALTILMLIFFYMPIVFMIVFSFNSSKSLTVFTGFSLQWYQRMLSNSSMMESLYVTIFVAVIATLVSTVVGTITAIGLSKSRKVVYDLVMQINDFPIMNPEIVTAIGLMIFFITLGIQKGLMTLVLAHIAFCIPYVILSVMPKLRSLDPDLADAAMDLGCTPWMAITKVIVPQIMPGIFSGALIAFTMSFDDFVISYFVTGGGIKNLSIMVYTMSKRVNPSINAISTVVVVMITLVLIIVNVVPIIKEKYGPKEKSTVKKTGLKVAIVALAALIIVSFTVYKKNDSTQLYAGQTLHIYNTGEYIGENILSDFEEYTGCTVVYDLFESNEIMYVKVASGESYDLLIPSDYMIERLIQEDLIQELDYSKIDVWNLINEDILDLSYDPGNVYSVPYFWGTVGIIYDTTVVDYEDLENDGYNIFLNQKYKGDLYLYDSERDSYMMALKALGYSMNTTDEDELYEAYEWLAEVVETMDPEIVTDEIIDNMVQARKALGLVYSGDATYIISENEDMDFYMPEGGTNIWVDAMVIPSNAQNTELAYEFINFITQYDQAYDNSEYVGYTSPNADVADELSVTVFDGIDAYIPRSDNENDEVFNYDEDARKIMANYWSKVKVLASNAN